MFFFSTIKFHNITSLIFFVGQNQQEIIRQKLISFSNLTSIIFFSSNNFAISIQAFHVKHFNHFIYILFHMLIIYILIKKIMFYSFKYPQYKHILDAYINHLTIKAPNLLIYLLVIIISVSSSLRWPHAQIINYSCGACLIILFLITLINSY